MSKNYSLAEKIGDSVGKLVYASQVDMGVFICSNNGAIGMFAAGKKEDFSDDYIPFLKEAIKRMQQVIDETENGSLSVSLDDPTQNKFITFEEDEAAENGEMGLSA